MNTGTPMASRSAMTEIPCCLCGTMISPNAANQCSSCLAQQVNLSQTLQRGPGGAHEITIHQCRQCRRFERTPTSFVNVEMESPELMGICLKHIPALHASNNTGSTSPRFHVVDALWVWTEPNSMRLKVRLTVRTEIQSVKIQQRCIVELHTRFKQCPDCNREYTNRTWHALVQVRQRREDDRKGLVLLEMALARNAKIRQHVISMDTTKQGFDFYFLSLHEAQQFSSYLARVSPMRIKTTKKLVSADVKSNTANMKHTVACDMVPLCRDDLVLVHKSVSKGNLTGGLCLVTKVSSVVHLVDASPKRGPSMDGVTGDVAPETYYKMGGELKYELLASAKRLSRFVVLDVELCSDTTYPHQQDERQLYEGPSSGVEKFALADVLVTREADFGVTQETFSCVTHLGHLLSSGDVVVGYDMVSSVLSRDYDEWRQYCNHSFVPPDVILVKKVQGSATEDPVGTDTQEKPTDRAKSARAKKKEKRRKREEKKSRMLEEAAERMGFLDKQDDLDDDRHFEEQLDDDPDLEEDLRAAEREFAQVCVDNKYETEGTKSEVTEEEG